jgi:tetratricopeptide (TPR) repeat protein
VDDEAATRIRLPPRLSRPTAWWRAGALLVLAVGVIVVAGARRSPSLPVTPAAALPFTSESIEAPVAAGVPSQTIVEPLSARAAETAPRPAPPARLSNGRGRRKSTAGTAAGRSARKRASATDRPARNAAAGEASEALALGEQALAAGELRLAEQDLRRALLFDPASGDALAALAEVRFERARYKEALLLAERAVRSAPDNPKYLVLLGDISFKLGLEADAAAAYARARVMRPDDAEIRARFDRVAGPPSDAPP